ncbi:uncharacterized protein KY384_007674 [Bacidia gigantensis]|uniref:uncharacterized protein n=1 Tax=Bacidia gigantensis TaxID=2732470 RepID=UPI001D055BFE|nr:uncharacterized protein KY384_007674 [Bacidia gigantensis]KAG8527522.1 hypothetical protein KY384_007674 [Bacidia gigantensis]
MTSLGSELPLLDTYQAVVSAYSDFLTVAIHTILFERDIYPQNAFIKARKYNYPVRQCRHPKVCKWIQDAVAAVELEMLKCSVSRTSLIIYTPPPTCRPLERYVFSSDSFPRVPPGEVQTPFARPNTISSDTNDADTSNPQPHPPPEPPTVVPHYTPPAPSNLPEQFRATLARLIPSISWLKALGHDDCTFTLAIELRDDDTAEAPLHRGEGEGKWIAAEPNLQKERMRGGESGEAGSNEGFEGRRKMGRDLGGVRTTPVRNLEAGAFAMEVWVEEARGKFEASVEEEEEDREGEKKDGVDE